MYFEEHLLGFRKMTLNPDYTQDEDWDAIKNPKFLPPA